MKSSVSANRVLNDLVMRLRPELFEWLGVSIGSKARHVIVDFYGLYGGERRRLFRTAWDLGIEADHARALRNWALRRLRDPHRNAELTDMIASTARKVLATRQENEARRKR
jgi:DNA-directed RNA polymerase sigma subunit (sigma70/sigma32)